MERKKVATQCMFLSCNLVLILGSEKVKRSVDHLLDIFQIERGTLRPIMVSKLVLRKKLKLDSFFQFPCMQDAASAIYTRAVQEVFKLVSIAC